MTRSDGGRRGPALYVVAAFAAAIVVGTLALMVPYARAGHGGAPPLVALFTATSAVCLTGHVVVDTSSYWTPFGQTMIVLLVQVGGFGIMTAASLLALLVSRRLGLRGRLLAASETKTLGLGSVRRVVVGVVVLSVIVEAGVAVVLTLRFWTAYDTALHSAAWQGIFHAVSAFNNAGFALFPNNLTSFVTDPVISLVVLVAFVLGGLGFPVLFELRRTWRRPRRLSLHSKITLWVTAVLAAIGVGAQLVLEWTNPATLGPLAVPQKALAGLFQGMTPRTAGFNTLDFGAMNETTWLVTDALMFIGTGSAGTGGGIKVTTFAILGFMIIAEARGANDVDVAGRRVAPAAQRQALAVALLGVGVSFLGTLLLLATSGIALDRVLFEAVSAFGTVGLSTGITAELPGPAQAALIVLMFIGRIGPVTAASALALRQQVRFYRLPEERPIVG
ncbi:MULTISPECIES: TrkH family potassium uptake protein [Protofrankia]|uniref:H(+)-transporting two-sector ATPase n=1 Tax=Candidatus Protofrankia datiscae TaxID=2716812 RepID=F8AWJ7_9ACTN|nr:MULTISPECIES: potassium transporter TrkG [Protofrankia]AEH09334.1 H(+)-transporting two-sector ATPase [Candidatus Protofrankia datiscae]